MRQFKENLQTQNSTAENELLRQHGTMLDREIRKFRRHKLLHLQKIEKDQLEDVSPRINYVNVI